MMSSKSGVLNCVIKSERPSGSDNGSTGVNVPTVDFCAGVRYNMVRLGYVR